MVHFVTTNRVHACNVWLQESVLVLDSVLDEFVKLLHFDFQDYIIHIVLLGD